MRDLKHPLFWLFLAVGLAFAWWLSTPPDERDEKPMTVSIRFENPLTEINR